MAADRTVRVWEQIGRQSLGAPVSMAHVCAAAVASVKAGGAAVVMMRSPTVRYTVHATNRVANELEEWQLTFGEGPCVDAFTSDQAADHHDGSRAVAPTTEQLLRKCDLLPPGDPARARLRARAIEKNIPLADSLARRYAGRGELLEDLKQVAAVALIKAVDNYDSSRSVPFAGYAVPSIRGALKRHFRDAAWGMRVPRATQELVLEAAIASDELTQRLGHRPTAAELADHLHLKPADLEAASMAQHSYRLMSLNLPLGVDETAEIIDNLGARDPRYDAVDNHLTLQPLVGDLPPRDRHILTLRFHRRMTQARIADEVGLSQMHVSRVLRRILSQLRAAMLF
ncbi:MAG: SigB/SigF/SigG family RNA polymerase sigma factor [Micromonosporaceae bacterium]